MAIFIIVILSFLGAALINIISSGTETVAREIVSSRALMAAESGVQRMLNDIYLGSQATCGNMDRKYDFPALLGCAEVNVDCNFVEVPVLSGDFYYTITSTGVCGPEGSEATRVIEVQAKNI